MYSSYFLCCHGAFLNVSNILLLSLFGFSIGLSSVRVTALMMDLVVWRTGNDEGVSHFTEPHLGALPWLRDSLCILSPSALPTFSSLPSKIFSWAQERLAWLSWMETARCRRHTPGTLFFLAFPLRCHSTDGSRWTAAARVTIRWRFYGWTENSFYRNTEQITTVYIVALHIKIAVCLKVWVLQA